MRTVLLDPNKVATLPYNPANRTSREDRDFNLLLEDIAANGQTDPVTVVPNPDPDEYGDEYTHVVVKGHRRRLCQLILGNLLLAVIDTTHSIEQILASENLQKPLNARDRVDRMIDGCTVPLSKYEQARLDRLTSIFGSRTAALRFLRPGGTGTTDDQARLGTSIVDLIDKACRLLMAHATKLQGFACTTPAEENALKKRIALWIQKHKARTLLASTCRASHGGAAAKRIWEALQGDRPLKQLLTSRNH